ncbi:MAG: hypothetical protein SGJ05_04410 [bacterium]|nr:hypothetical protein [bacterium]
MRASSIAIDEQRPEIGMLTIPLSRGEYRISIDAHVFNVTGSIVPIENHIVTMSYRHFAPRQTVFHDTLTALKAETVFLGTSKALRGRVGALSLSTEIISEPLIVRVTWKTHGADECEIFHHDTKLRGPGIVVIPGVFTYE